MSSTSAETQQTKKPAMDPPKKFSKIKLLQSLGLLSRKFNPKTSEFESSLSLSLFFWASMISREWFIFKLPVSYFFPKHSSIQLIVGNPFNYLPEGGRFFMGIAGFVAGVWGFTFNYVFSWLNAQNDYKLFRIWMRMTREVEILAKSDRDYWVAGLSRRRNKQFWETENYVNRLWHQVFLYYIAFASLLCATQLFFTQFEGVDIFSAKYILLQTIHVLNAFHSFYAFFHCVFTLSLYHITCMRFFARRFHHIGKQVKHLNGSVERVSCQKLSRLIVEHQIVHHELIFINDFFKNYSGYNLLCLFATGVATIFSVLLDIGLMFNVGNFSLIMVLYCSIVLLPCIAAASVRNEINWTRRQFENIAFHHSVNRIIRQKIESISELSEKAGFTVFTWFLLNPYTGFQISLEFITCLLLLIQAYHYYSKF